jgi:hypothetical protein
MVDMAAFISTVAIITAVIGMATHGMAIIAAGRRVHG